MTKKTKKKKTKARKKRTPKKKRAVPAANLDLEAQIAAAPDAPDPFLVYGDWLQQSGDPRGELVALQAARLTATRSSGCTWQWIATATPARRWPSSGPVASPGCGPWSWTASAGWRPS
jgi:uncharacterized protein (TIGR02996 family)